MLPTTPPILVSTSSDKTFRLWDLSPLETRSSPTSRQIVKEHTRPVDTAAYALVVDAEVSTVTVYTADSMGVIKQWAIPQASRADLRC